jgi:hypothetical protein
VFTRIVLFLFFGVFLICSSIFFYGAYTDNESYKNAPTDQALIEIFRKHKSTFETLHQMINKDPGWYYSTTTQDPRLSEAKNREYRKLLSEINSNLVAVTSRQYSDADDTDINNSSHDINFIFASGGTLINIPQWQKGIYYLTKNSRFRQTGTFVDNLDNPDSLPKGRFYFHAIEGNWYVGLDASSWSTL